MSRTVLGLIPVFTFLAGCGGVTPIGPVPPGMGEEVYANLQLYAARNLNCEREKLTYESFGKGRHLFKGCDQQIEMIVFTGADAQAYGFARGFVVPSAADRFAKELKCDLRTTTEERIDHRTHVVEGCSKRITYVNVCNPNCSWIANVESDKK